MSSDDELRNSGPVRGPANAPLSAATRCAMRRVRAIQSGSSSAIA